MNWKKKHDKSWKYKKPSSLHEEKLGYTTCPYGKRKLSYVTRRVALEAAAKYRTQDERVRTPYLCRQCFDWHLTTHGDKS